MGRCTMIGRGEKDLIQVIDNFFSDEIHQEIYNLMIRPKWSFTGGNDLSPFWHMDNLENEVYFNHFLFNLIQSKLDKKFNILRIYANGQTAGQNGTAHPDNKTDEYRRDVTFLYYPNLKWRYSWGGHLVFLDEVQGSYMDVRKQYVLHDITPSTKVSEIVTYVPNRAILFPSHIWHHSLEPNRSFNGLRISLAYKLVEI